MKKYIFTLAYVLMPLLLLAQTKVEGTVSDETGEPLPGVSVTVKGTNKGTLTNMDGKFVITLASDDKELSFSFIGYSTQTVNIQDRKPVNVKMVPDVIGLEEVVAVGYGTQKKVNLLGAVENLSMKELETRPLTNTSMALQGQVAGVDVVQTSGEPGNDHGQIRIRGISSIENNNEPLVLIDGIEGDINEVNPKDIESISVLKDASSAAIYGSRAAAGVVLITTKSGSEGRLKVTYGYNFGMQQATSMPEPVDVYTWIDLKQEMLTYNGQKAQADALETVRQEYLNGTKVATNYYDEFFRVAPQHDHYMNFSGGTKYLKGSASLGYSSQDGVLRGTSVEKYTFRTSLDATSKNKIINFKLNLSGSRRNRDEYTVSSNTVINNVHRSGPVSVFRAQNGLYGYYGMYYAQKEFGGGSWTNNNAINGRAQINLNLFKGFQLSGALNVNYGDAKRRVFAPPLYTASDLYGDSQSKQKSYYEVTNTSSFSTTAEAIARYNTVIDRKHRINAMIGYSQYKFEYATEYARRDDYTTFVPSLVHGSSSTQSNRDTQSERTLLSAFGRVGYTLLDRYMFEVNFRADGSSRFRNNKWGYFPSVSAGWRISEEPFFKNADRTRFVDNLKLRLSWGRLGNESIGAAYTGFDEISFLYPYDFGGSIVSGAALAGLSNPNTTWETTEQTNVGIDFSFLKSFTISLDYFYKYTYDVLMRLPLPLSLGSPIVPYQNAGTMENQGFEVMINYKKAFTRDFTFNASFTASHLRNKILSLNGQGPIPHATTDNSTSVLLSAEGHPYGSFYGYNVIGIFQESDFTWQNNSDPDVPVQDRNYVLKPGIPTQAENPKPGDLRFEDISGPDGVPDGTIDLDHDRKIIGSQFPDLTYSFNIGGEYKGFDFNLFFHGVAGRDLYSCGAMVVPFVNDNGNVWKEMVGSRWTYENPSTTHPRLFNDNARLTMRSNYYLQDASFLRLKNVEIGYTFPKNLMKKIWVDRLRIYAGVQNAFTFTKFKGWDPERPAENISSDVYPQVRVYNVGVNISF